MTSYNNDNPATGSSSNMQQILASTDRDQPEPSSGSIRAPELRARRKSFGKYSNTPFKNQSETVKRERLHRLDIIQKNWPGWNQAPGPTRNQPEVRTPLDFSTIFLDDFARLSNITPNDYQRAKRTLVESCMERDPTQIILSRDVERAISILGSETISPESLEGEHESVSVNHHPQAGPSQSFKGKERAASTLLSDPVEAESSVHASNRIREHEEDSWETLSPEEEDAFSMLHPYFSVSP